MGFLSFYFLSSSSSFSSPNLSGHILDVCHTSTHGVALVRIYNAGLKCAALDSMEMPVKKIAKNSPSVHHRTNLSGYVFTTKACSDNRKKLVKQHYLHNTSLQYGELRPTSNWDLLASLGHPSKFQRVSCLSRLGSVTARHSSSGRQPNFAVLNRGRHLYVIGPHSSISSIAPVNTYFW